MIRVAEVFKRASNGMKVTKVIALHKVTQWSLRVHTQEIAQRAKAILRAAPHGEGHSDIETSKGRIDHYVTLTDERGLGAAMSIEYGRGEGTTSSWGPMDPVAPLRWAATLPVPPAQLKHRKPNDAKRGRRR